MKMADRLYHCFEIRYLNPLQERSVILQKLEFGATVATKTRPKLTVKNWTVAMQVTLSKLLEI